METDTRSAAYASAAALSAAAVVSACVAAVLTAVIGPRWGIGLAVLVAVPAAALRAARDRKAAVVTAEWVALAQDNGRRVEELGRRQRASTEFVASLSHELRTPLNVIIGYSDLLVDHMFGELSPEQHEAVRRIGEQGRELLELVTSTLDVSRLESGRSTLSVRRIDVLDLLAEIELEAQLVRRNAALDIAWQVAPDLPALWTDPVKLKMVLKNVLLNAIKFTDEGGVVVHAAARHDGVEFTVADSGIGIAPDMLRRIFEPFRQGDQGDRRGGAGLGLHIVRRLLEMLGGRIEVESEVDHGSTFRVWVPCLAPVERRNEPERAATPPPFDMRPAR